MCTIVSPYHFTISNAQNLIKRVDDLGRVVSREKIILSSVAYNSTLPNIKEVRNKYWCMLIQ